ncbi:unnamed protein product [Urochloa humidicola]
MEAAALSAVVSMTLKVVGNKLAPLLVKRYSNIVGVKKDLQELMDQVEEINSWLDTRYEYMWNDPTFNWLKRLKDVAYTIDDVVDEFQLKAEKYEASGGGGILSRYMFAKPESFILQCKVASKIKKIKRTFATVVKQRADYSAITNSIAVDPPVQQTNVRTGRMSPRPDIEVTSVVGRDEDKKHIISKLEEIDDQLKIKIISIIGLGGSGKTTLAKLVFNDGNMKEHFEFTLWVHVSQKFDVDELVKKMFEAFADNNPGQHGVPYMRKTISDKLIGKRFFLVLDDVWTESQFQWEDFREFLINIGALGSRILLTTRSSKVAETVGSTDLFMLPLLTEASSWQLFTESYGVAANNLTSEFLKVGKEIICNCGGVPLAIKVLAGVLRDKEQIEQWVAIRDNNLLCVEGEEHRVAACLWLSYFHLPSNLKQCFTICSIFPKGHRIDKEQLIDQWIVNDMITMEDGVECLEYVGHKHFNYLIQTSFLQNVQEVFGRVTCGMHDLVHDLARSILGDQISLFMPNQATSTTKSYRYFSLNEHPENLVPKNSFGNVRVAYLTRCDDCIYGAALKHAKHLRSITVEFVGYPYSKTPVSSTIFQVKYLKYLAMSRLNCETLPDAISDIWSLQALHVTHCLYLLKLPESIGKLKKLRTLNLSGCEDLKSLPDSIGDCQMVSSIGLFRCRKLTVLPNSVGKLRKLRVLNLSQCTRLKCLPESIGDCQMISSIDLCRCEKLTMLPNSIGKLHKLTTLNLSWCEELKCLPDSIGGCQMISRLDLCNCKKLTMLPNSIGRNKNLRVLRLPYTKIERLPSSITTLRNLECLDLCGCLELVELPEGIGNLEKLEVLNLKECRSLRGMPIGIGKLNRLQKLGLFVVSKSKKFAGVSELANVGRNSEDLTIRGIACVMEPDDAYRACLKQKTNLQRLDLQWMTYGHDAGEVVNTELYQAVLNGLEPPPSIKELEIFGYSGRQYAQWMQNQLGGGLLACLFNNLQRDCLEKKGGGKIIEGFGLFPFLRVMKLHYFPNLKHLHVLTLLPCLEELELLMMPSLVSISSGPFPSLVKLVMHGLPSLGEVWLVAERTMLDGEEAGAYSNFRPHLGQVGVGNCLSDLSILDCPKLKVKPYLPSSLQSLHLHRGNENLLQSPGPCQGSSSSPTFRLLKKLELQGMTGLGSGRGWELLRHMIALESLQIYDSYELTKLPESLGSLTSLQSLKVESCAIHVLPECLGELHSLQELTISFCHSLSSLPQSTTHLTSLQVLRIGSCDALLQLPECLGELRSLRALEIHHLPGLTCLPRALCGLTFLKELSIRNCPGLTSLPQGMNHLASLEKLLVYWSPGIKSMPEGIKDLDALQELWIHGCPDLVMRCSQGNGEDWHLISHIPRLYIQDPDDCTNSSGESSSSGW